MCAGNAGAGVPRTGRDGGIPAPCKRSHLFLEKSSRKATGCFSGGGMYCVACGGTACQVCCRQRVRRLLRFSRKMRSRSGGRFSVALQLGDHIYGPALRSRKSVLWVFCGSDAVIYTASVLRTAPRWIARFRSSSDQRHRSAMTVFRFSESRSDHFPIVLFLGILG